MCTRTGTSVAADEATSNAEALGNARQCGFSSGWDFWEAQESKLRGLLDAHKPTADLYVRVRLTRLSASTYGLSVRRHTGRWERTPFSGNMKEMVDTILGCMQHLVAPY